MKGFPIVTEFLGYFHFLGSLRSPRNLFVVGIICTCYGIYLIKCGYEGDTLMPGTQFTYLPRWLFYTVGLILQLPLLGAWLFLRSTGYM
jgi:hypothetical protein